MPEHLFLLLLFLRSFRMSLSKQGERFVMATILDGRQCECLMNGCLREATLSLMFDVFLTVKLFP